MGNNFGQLHCHSTFSALDGYGTPDQMVERLLELGQTFCAITDHGETYGWLEFDSVMRKAGLKPIFGLEAYLVESMERKGKSRKDEESGQTILGDQRAHLTLLSTSEVGYRNLLQIHRESFSRGYYYKPRVDWDTVIKYQEGVAVLSGCLGGMLSRQIVQGHVEQAWGWAKYLSKRIEQFYVEIIPCPDIEASKIACAELVRIARDLKLPMVLTNDAHFPSPEHHNYEDVMLCIGLKTTLDDKTRMTRIPEYCYICGEDDLAERARIAVPNMTESEISAALSISGEIASRIDFEVPKSRGPMYPLDMITVTGDSGGEVARSKTPTEQLLEWVEEGKKRRIETGQIPCYADATRDEAMIAVYEAREQRELAIIKKFGFENYFLIVSDIVRYVYGQGEICVARGSCGGSLVCWYLRITQVDPIRFDLPMERFIEESRPDEPDIDLDFPCEMREKVMWYLLEKYGEDKCGMVAGLSYFRTGQTIRDVGKVLKVPKDAIESLAKVVPKTMGADEAVKVDNVLSRFFEDNAIARDILRKHPQLEVAKYVEGQMRHSTVHAAGFVVNDEPIHHFCGVVHRPGQLPIVCATKDYLQARGLLKIDVLGLATLDIIGKCLKHVGKNVGWLETLPLDDERTYETLSEGLNAGIFQLQGGSCGPLMKQLKPKNIHDVVALSVLCRPGPLQSGGTREYIERKYGRMPMPEYHPTLMEIVGGTYGVIIYQEQCMQLGEKIGGFDGKRVHRLRKMITSTSYGASDVDKEFWTDYIAGARERGIPEEQAFHAWEQAKKAGNYVFNKAHAYAYGWVGYLTAYFKTHYPAIFASMCAAVDDDDAKRIKLFAEFRKVGGKLEFLDYDRSHYSYRAIDAHTIVGGFSDIDGVGEKTAATIISGQPYGSWDAFYSSLKPALRAKIASTMVHTGDPDLAMVSKIAPWLVDMTWSELERQFVDGMRPTPIGEILDRMDDASGSREICVYGKVIDILEEDMYKLAKKYGQDPPKEGEPYLRAKVTVADDTGSLTLSFNRWRWDEIKQLKDPLQGLNSGRGNGAYVRGEISADYARAFGADVLVVWPLRAREQSMI